MKRLIYLTLLLAAASQIKAQSELTLPFMRDVFQSSYINPTVIPEHTFSMGIGTCFYGQYISNGFKFDNVMKFQDDSMHINPYDLLDDLKSKNMFYLGENADLFHIRVKTLNGYYWFGIRQNLSATIYYPKELFSVAIEGNEPYIGQTLDFKNLKVDASLYNEFSFGMMKEFPRWVFGGRISLLQGLSNVHLDPDILDVKIEDDMYEHVGRAKAKLYTAGIPKDGDGDPSFDNVDDSEWLSDYFTNLKNRGFALSGGATYKYNDKTSFSFSFYNLGFITWKDSVETYTFNGESDFDGFDLISDWLYNDDVDIDSLTEVIKDDFNRDTVYSSYRTWLNPKFNLSASYNVAKRTSLGLSFSGVYNKKFYPAVTVGVQQGLGRLFSIVATASINQSTYNNIGLGFIFKPGPFQIFAITDNAFIAINPLKATNTNVRVGINLVFGRAGQPEGMPFK